MRSGGVIVSIPEVAVVRHSFGRSDVELCSALDVAAHPHKASKTHSGDEGL